MKEEYLPIPLITCMPFFLNNAKCTYFHPKMYLRVQKVDLVNNVLENQIWAVPLLVNYVATIHLHLKLHRNGLTIDTVPDM